MAFLSVLVLLCAFSLSDAGGRLRKFHLLKDQINITEVQKTCQTNYTNIVTVYDHKDNEELVQMINGTGALSALIGAHSNKTNYMSKWSNDDDVKFTPFIENCTSGICGAAMRTNGSWELLPHNTLMYFMCYDEGVDRASHNFSLIPLNKTWTEAQVYCRENHKDLISIRNEQENERVQNETKEFSFWIGLLYDNIEWIDGGKSAYRKYPLGVGFGDWLILGKNDWMKRKNDSIYHGLCYKSLIHVSYYRMFWEEALDYCNRNASGLLRIESEEDQIETERELRRRHISDPVWIGLRQSRLFGFWMWVNGLHVGSWSNWKGGSPPEHQISHHCGAIEKVNGTFKWSDKDCRYRFIVLCEAK